MRLNLNLPVKPLHMVPRQNRLKPVTVRTQRLQILVRVVLPVPVLVVNVQLARMHSHEPAALTVRFLRPFYPLRYTTLSGVPHKPTASA